MFHFADSEIVGWDSRYDGDTKKKLQNQAQFRGTYEFFFIYHKNLNIFYMIVLELSYNTSKTTIKMT